MPRIDPRTLFSPTILLALALMAVIVMMILPMPAWVLDVGLAASFALAILIFTLTLFIERPLDFSSFPTILLASLMLRLSLNVSSTKLIIGQGHTGTNAAGDVIEGFAQFVMSGSIFLGLVVFGVLLIVNFMVITKGAARMAEVGARFALDGMPGKQLAIDSDMSAGAIDHQQAKERREREQQETTFFGSLDGASKFVKGDAIAGLLITLLNLVMGLVMGVIVHGMPVTSAFETYAILTVGDGLVSQIPAVIISIASALLLARGGTQGATDNAIFSQLGRHPAALGTVAVLMALFALVPGLPFLPFILGAGVLGYAAYSGIRKRSEEAETDPEYYAAHCSRPADRSVRRVRCWQIHVAGQPRPLDAGRCRCRCSGGGTRARGERVCRDRPRCGRHEAIGCCGCHLGPIRSCPQTLRVVGHVCGGTSAGSGDERPASGRFGHSLCRSTPRNCSRHG